MKEKGAHVSSCCQAMDRLAFCPPYIHAIIVRTTPQPECSNVLLQWLDPVSSHEPLEISTGELSITDAFPIKALVEKGGSVQQVHGRHCKRNQQTCCSRTSGVAEWAHWMIRRLHSMPSSPVGHVEAAFSGFLRPADFMAWLKNNPDFAMGIHVIFMVQACHILRFYWGLC